MNIKKPFDGYRLFGGLLLLCTSPLWILLSKLGHPDRGFGAWVCSMFVLFAIRVNWNLRGSVLFWLTVSVLTLLQFPIILFVPWSNHSKLPLVLLSVGILDNALVYGSIKIVEVVRRRYSSN
jgi:hypothetical protein